MEKQFMTGEEFLGILQRIRSKYTWKTVNGAIRGKSKRIWWPRRRYSYCPITAVVREAMGEDFGLNAATAARRLNLSADTRARIVCASDYTWARNEVDRTLRQQLLEAIGLQPDSPLR